MITYSKTSCAETIITDVSFYAIIIGTTIDGHQFGNEGESTAIPIPVNPTTDGQIFGNDEDALHIIHSRHILRTCSALSRFDWDSLRITLALCKHFPTKSHFRNSEGLSK